MALLAITQNVIVHLVQKRLESDRHDFVWKTPMGYIHGGINPATQLPQIEWMSEPPMVVASTKDAIQILLDANKDFDLFEVSGFEPSVDDGQLHDIGEIVGISMDCGDVPVIISIPLASVGETYIRQELVKCHPYGGSWIR